MPALIDLSGKRVGELLILSRSQDDASGKPMWRCACDCGESAVVSGAHLRRGHTTSCGCHRKRALVAARTKHGFARKKDRPPEYAVWKSMIQRCESTTCKDYHRYGARGISVCARWRNDFAAFFSDMGPRLSAKHSIDRIDNDGNYEPGNCRWATSIQQNNNRRKIT